ncbi:MAG: hypothetical protein KDJ39_05910 [Gammaproteobacteria bacterium]|nr:hypothetical protein [Gammaproteobacteria bacterium]
MDDDFILRLQLVRTDLGVPFSPVRGGGYRCALYLRETNNEYSAHGEGKAIDPDLDRRHYHAFMRLCLRYGFTGFGMKQKSGQFQIHVDTAQEIPGKRPRPWAWTY